MSSASQPSPGAPPPRRHQRRRRSVRTRVTIAASLAITIAVTGGIILLYLVQISSVRRTIDQQLRTYLTQLTQEAGHWPSTLPPSTLDPAAQAQVITATGTVAAATQNLAGRSATFTLPSGSDTPIRLKGADGVIPEDVATIGTHLTVNGQQFTIIVGTQTGLLTSLRSSLTTNLLYGFPGILLLAGAAVWILVGRSLSPVERIRHAVTDITSADLTSRVPDPGTNDEIGRLARTMNDMLARLENSARAQRRFVADASHELRSPLAAIRTTLDVALAHPSKAPWPAIATTAVEQTERMERLISQLLELAKADEHTPQIQPEPVDLEQLLTDVIAAAAAAKKQTQAIELTLSGVHNVHAVVLGSHDQLARLFGNIVDNAVRHAHTQVVVSIRATPEIIEVRIVDDGPGISAEDRERVFDRFVRLDSSRDRHTGNTGLGLAIANEIATAHRGRITIVEPATPGTHVLIELPIGGKGPAAVTDDATGDRPQVAGEPSSDAARLRF